MWAHRGVRHSMCGSLGYASLRANPCPALCSAWGNNLKPVPWLWNPGVCTLPQGEKAKWSRQARIVSYRKWSKEWSCSVWVTSRSSAQPCGPRSTAIYKIPLWPSSWQGWTPILKSTICSSVHILRVPRDYATALQAWPLSNTIGRWQRGNKPPQMLTTSSPARSPGSAVSFAHDTSSWHSQH